MAVGEADVVCPTDLALAAFNRAGEPKRLEIIPGGHFSAYTDQFERCDGGNRLVHAASAAVRTGAKACRPSVTYSSAPDCLSRYWQATLPRFRCESVYRRH